MPCIFAADSTPSQPDPVAVSAPSAVVQPATPDPSLRAIAGKNLWRVSLLTLGAANAMDIQSSWGKHELNPGLAGPTGVFSAQGALLKLGFQGGLIGVEYLLTRHRPSPRLYRALAIINFGASAGIAGVAAHNYTVAPPGR